MIMALIDIRRKVAVNGLDELDLLEPLLYPQNLIRFKANCATRRAKNRLSTFLLALSASSLATLMLAIRE